MPQKQCLSKSSKFSMETTGLYIGTGLKEIYYVEPMVLILDGNYLILCCTRVKEKYIFFHFYYKFPRKSCFEKRHKDAYFEPKYIFSLKLNIGKTKSLAVYRVLFLSFSGPHNTTKRYICLSTVEKASPHQEKTHKRHAFQAKTCFQE